MPIETIGYVSDYTIHNSFVAPEVLIERAVSDYADTLSGGLGNISSVSIARSKDDAGYDVRANVPSASTASSNGIKWALHPGSSTNISPFVPLTTTVYPPDTGSSVEVKGSSTELSEESKALLKSVEEKVSELLGKHPYARMANMRKALDELLAEKDGGGQFDGANRVSCVDGLDGWIARCSHGMWPKRVEVVTEIMPTEMEAIAELIRMTV